MRIDFSEIFAEGAGFLVKQLFFIVAAVWVGCTLAGAGGVMGILVADDRVDIRPLLGSPVLLLSVWLLPNVIFLGINICRFMIYSESTGLRTWACLIGGEALFCMGSVTSDLKEKPLGLLVAWLVCLILIAMECTAFWYFNAWRMNRWSAELVAVQAENAQLRRELKDEFGTEGGGGPPIV